MDDQHTPGPWIVRHDFKAANGDLAIGVAAADMAKGGAVAWPAGTSDEKNLANARLIAQAPSLVSALQAVLDDFKEVFIAAGGERPMSELMDEWRALPSVISARATINRSIRG